MSKFLKFIVHFVVICTILCVVALAVPPFLGITTEIMDDSGAETNLTLGSVTYAIPAKVEEVSAGTPILVQGESGVYRYNIVSLDLENHTGVVIDSKASGSETVNVAIKNRVPKVVITVPYLGYLLIATESVEGLIILGLAVLFLIILYVIAELWKKEPADEYDEDEEDTSYIKSAKELKREEKERERRMREEDRQLLKSEKTRKKEEKKKRKIIKTGGFVDEVYEDELEEEPPRRRANVQSATSEAHELLKKEIAAATAEEPEKPAPKKTRKAAPAQEKARKSAKPKKAPVKKEVPPAEVKKMAIPVRSAAQLADMAKQEGDAPDIVKDGITKVTLFDYSDIIGEFDEEE
ncbi:MAG: hypothetical protein Q4C77_15895 [Eubacteriales bacterium]|nr:hypothetical protein [Eubacteriales bacterium]